MGCRIGACARVVSPAKHRNASPSNCDAPLTLTNFTFDYLEKEWSKEIDFVVCECGRLAMGR